MRPEPIGPRLALLAVAVVALGAILLPWFSGRAGPGAAREAYHGYATFSAAGIAFASILVLGTNIMRVPGARPMSIAVVAAAALAFAVDISQGWFATAVRLRLMWGWYVEALALVGLLALTVPRWRGIIEPVPRSPLVSWDALRVRRG